MARNQAPAPAPVEETAPAAPETPTAAPLAFELGETELGLIVRKGGREVTPSRYLEEVRGAIGTDKALGIKIPEGEKGTKVISEIRRAAKQLHVHVRIWDRSDAAKSKLPEGTPPFIGFKVIDKPTKADDAADAADDGE